MKIIFLSSCFKFYSEPYTPQSQQVPKCNFKCQWSNRANHSTFHPLESDECHWRQRTTDWSAPTFQSGEFKNLSLRWKLLQFCNILKICWMPHLNKHGHPTCGRVPNWIEQRQYPKVAASQKSYSFRENVTFFTTKRYHQHTFPQGEHSRIFLCIFV